MNKQTPDYSIFISYRRAGGAQFARILKAELEKRGYLIVLPIFRQGVKLQ